MELTFLGLGAAFYPRLRNNCAMWKKENILYLFDCGSTAFSVLTENNVLEGVSDIRVLVTHRHQDHVGSLATLLSYCGHVTGQRARVVHPDSRIADLLQLMGVAKESYEADFAEDPGCPGLYRDECLRAAFVPVRHTSSLPAWGLDVSDGSERIYYSGDAENLPEQEWRDFCVGKIARWYQDTALTRGAPPAGHGDYRAFVQNCPEHLRRRFYPMHWNTDLSDAVRRDGFGLCPVLPFGEKPVDA